MMDFQILEVLLRNWSEYLLKVAGHRPHRDVIVLAFHVTLAVLAGRAAVHAIRKRIS